MFFNGSTGTSGSGTIPILEKGKLGRMCYYIIARAVAQKPG